MQLHVQYSRFLLLVSHYRTRCNQSVPYRFPFSSTNSAMNVGPTHVASISSSLCPTAKTVFAHRPLRRYSCQSCRATFSFGMNSCWSTTYDKLNERDRLNIMQNIPTTSWNYYHSENLCNLYCNILYYSRMENSVFGIWTLYLFV